MPRPTTKEQLLNAANEQSEKLRKLIDSMSEGEMNTPFDFGDNPKLKEAHWKRDKNMRDILTHLYEWHQLLINWVNSNQSGDSKPFLPEPYNWKTYGNMNIGFWEKHQNTDYEKSKEMFWDSYKEVLDLINGFSNEELFEIKHFPWTGTTSLGSYCVSATSSHYDWAMKKIKAHIKLCKEA